MISEQFDENLVTLIGNIELPHRSKNQTMIDTGAYGMAITLGDCRCSGTCPHVC